MRTAIEIVDCLLHGLRTGNPRSLPLAERVVLEGAPAPRRLEGAEVAGFLLRVAAFVEDLRVERHIAEGPWVATLLALGTQLGRISAFACFRLSNGVIEEIQLIYGASGTSLGEDHHA